MIVALYYATDYINKLIETLLSLGVSETIVKAVKCFDVYCFRNNRGIAGAKFRKDLNTINNSLAQKVANAIISESDRVPNVVLKTFNWIKENGDWENFKHSVCIALNCNTTDERVTALLHNVFSYSSIGLE